MGCATGTIKYLLFIFNTLWAIFGIIVILFGGFGWGGMPDKYAIGIIVLGIIILLISMFGCFGAIRESKRMLWTYVTLLIILIILVVLYMVTNSRDVFKKYAIKDIEDIWVKELTNPGSMDSIQQTYSCCGLHSPSDYLKIGRTPPSSCCKENNCINPLNLHIDSCLTAVERVFSDEDKTTLLYEWGVLGFDLVLIVLASILAIHYTNRQRRYNY